MIFLEFIVFLCQRQQRGDVSHVDFDGSQLFLRLIDTSFKSLLIQLVVDRVDFEQHITFIDKGSAPAGFRFHQYSASDFRSNREHPISRRFSINIQMKRLIPYLNFGRFHQRGNRGGIQPGCVRGNLRTAAKKQQPEDAQTKYQNGTDHIGQHMLGSAFGRSQRLRR